MANQIAATRWPWVTFKVIHLLQAFSTAFFRTTVAAINYILSDNASRGPYAIAELTVFIIGKDKMQKAI